MKAEAAIKEPYTRYILQADDFKFITPPKVAKTPSPPPVTIDSLLAESLLGYTSAWEFIAERFHCDEAFLRYINQALKETSDVGGGMKVFKPALRRWDRRGRGRDG